MLQVPTVSIPHPASYGLRQNDFCSHVYRNAVSITFVEEVAIENERYARPPGKLCLGKLVCPAYSNSRAIRPRTNLIGGTG